MGKIIYYVATSLDSKIADANGQVDWLHDLPNPQGIDHGYEAFTIPLI